MKELLLGNEAIARGVYEAGATVASSYPGTPSTEITECLAKYGEIDAEWAPNEKVALEVAVGASIAGARTMTAMKHVGLNVAADPLFTASYTGVNGGLVVCVADDQGMHSSQNEQDSRHYARAAKLPMLEPSDSQECKDFVKQAFALSETHDTPVMIRLSTRISHSRGLVALGEREEVPRKAYQKDPGKYVMMPAMARVRHQVVEGRMAALRLLAETIPVNTVEYHDKKIGVIAAGIACQYAKEALGERASYCKLGMIYPLPDQMLKDFAASVDTCYVLEELDPFIEDHCRGLGLAVTGKGVFGPLGEYTAARIREAVLGETSGASAAVEGLPGRPPVMCAGCPHRAVFHVLHQLKLTVSGDIGCYTLGALPPLGAIDACLCMGGSISMAHGMDKAGKSAVAVIGDSTFIHSGITGLIDVVYNKGTSTVMILDNSITGMTGHQDNPATGRTLKGEPAPALDLVKLCQAVGVKRVKVVDPFDKPLLLKTVQEEVAAAEPSVIIAQRPCALLKSVTRGSAVVIDTQKCKDCGACMRIGCPAIRKQDGTMSVDSSVCVGCGYCAGLCKFAAIAAPEVRA